MFRVPVVVALLLLAGCGARAGAGPAAPPGSVDDWVDKMRRAESVRYDIEFKSEGARSSWWTKSGAMSPKYTGVMIASDQPFPTTSMTYRASSSYSTPGGITEYQVVERDSATYVKDSRISVPPGKSWVRLEYNGGQWVANLDQEIRIEIRGLDPSGAFVDMDTKHLTISAGVAEELDGVRTFRYDLTSSASRETSSNAAHDKPVTATVWIGPDGLPTKIVQRSTGSGGYANTRTSRFKDWNATPLVELPPAAETASAREAGYTQPR